MGNPKLKWTREEEDALRRGVAKHGAGKWKNIHQDPEFGPALTSRSNIDLKDKWRNLGVASGQITRDKTKLKSKAKNAKTPTVTPMIVASTTEVVMSESLNAPNRAQAIAGFKEIKNRPTIKTEEPPAERESHQQTSDLVLTEAQASLWVALRIAEAENTSAVAAESMREAERISAMAEESEALLQFATNCLEASEIGDVLLIS